MGFAVSVLNFLALAFVWVLGALAALVLILYIIDRTQRSAAMRYGETIL